MMWVGGFVDSLGGLVGRPCWAHTTTTTARAATHHVAVPMVKVDVVSLGHEAANRQPVALVQIVPPLIGLLLGHAAKLDQVIFARARDERSRDGAGGDGLGLRGRRRGSASSEKSREGQKSSALLSRQLLLLASVSAESTVSLTGNVLLDALVERIASVKRAIQIAQHVLDRIPRVAPHGARLLASTEWDSLCVYCVGTPRPLALDPFALRLQSSGGISMEMFLRWQNFRRQF